ncbi:hypothetical protein PARMER_02578 [Parabacteroides merdae ATCC 43184]|nr:hypothetical protein PARMER_02578 [Parabacteroides merdae ATCC 43184]
MFSYLFYFYYNDSKYTNKSYTIQQDFRATAPKSQSTIFYRLPCKQQFTFSE